MKTIKTIHKVLILISVLFYTSCSESLIDKPLQPGTQSDVSFRQTAVGLLGTLNTAYSPLAGSQWQ